MTSDIDTLARSHIEKEKARYAAMSLDEKRLLYRTREFVMLDNLKTWTTYAKEKKLFSVRPFFEKNEVYNDKVSLWQGDITKLEIDAIVNAANYTLLIGMRGDEGVDYAINVAAGPNLQMELSLFPAQDDERCATGDAKLSSGYDLPARFVVHVVGPMLSRKETPLTGAMGSRPIDLLKQCYIRALDIAKENAIRSIAFPCISTGAYSYPNEDAAHLALKTVREWLAEDGNATTIDRIIFCCFSEKDKDIYETALTKYFPVCEKQSNGG